jgi:hypothetical protein
MIREAFARLAHQWLVAHQHTCPGEMKACRLVEIAQTVICKQEGFEVDILDLSCATSEFEKSERGPCVGAVMTAFQAQ